MKVCYFMRIASTEFCAHFLASDAFNYHSVGCTSVPVTEYDRAFKWSIIILIESLLWDFVELVPPSCTALSLCVSFRCLSVYRFQRVGVVEVAQLFLANFLTQLHN